MIIYLSLGANLANKEKNIFKALELLLKKRVRILKKSAVYKTEPYGVKNQPWFLNLCVKARTNLKPRDLLELCQQIEREIGRKKREKWQPREIDIDILFYGQKIIEEKKIKIPHPLIFKRRFVLEPLNEIAWDFIHPVLKKNMKELLRGCKDKGIVQKEEN